MADFIITYRRSSGESVIEQFSDPAQALKERLRREAAIDDPNVEIAHISAPSPDSLRKSHSRYFMGSVEIQDDQVDAA